MSTPLPRDRSITSSCSFVLPMMSSFSASIVAFVGLVTVPYCCPAPLDRKMVNCETNSPKRSCNTHKAYLDVSTQASRNKYHFRLLVGFANGLELLGLYFGILEVGDWATFERVPLDLVSAKIRILSLSGSLKFVVCTSHIVGTQCHA